jgi:alpha-tubulin suppressor-like RCC1 family protein
MFFDYKNIERVFTHHGESYMLKTDGSFWQCGRDPSNILGCEMVGTNTCKFFLDDEDLTKIEKVVVGWGFNAVLKTDGTLWTCGNNEYGQLGLGDFTNRPILEKTNMTDVKDIIIHSMGDNIFVIKNDNTLWGCGYAANHILGTDGTQNESEFVYITDNVKSAHPGVDHMFIIKNDDSIWCIGSNHQFKLGLPEPESALEYTGLIKRFDLTNVKDIVCGYSDTFIIKNDGTLWGAGSIVSNYILKTDDEVPTITTFTKLSDISNFEKIYGCYRTFVFKTSDGKFYGAGYNGYGQLGLGHTNALTEPLVQLTVENIVDIHFTQLYALYETENGYYMTNYAGSLVDFDFKAETNLSVDSLIMEGISDLNFILKDENGNRYFHVYKGAVGIFSNYGQMNKIYSLNREFKLIPEIKNVKEVKFSDTMYATTYVLTKDGFVYGRGENRSGQLGIGNQETQSEFVKLPIDNVKQIAAGNEHLLVLKNDGTLWATGSNYYGELGIGSTTRVITNFTQANVSDASIIKDIYAYNIFSAIIDENGAVYGAGSGYRTCTGSDRYTYSFTKSSTVTSGAKKIISTGYDTFVLKEDGTVWQCGDGHVTCRHETSMSGETVTANLTQIPELTNIKDLEPIYESSGVFFINNNNEIYATGTDSYCQFGDDSVYDIKEEYYGKVYKAISTPKRILQNITNIKDIYPRAQGLFYTTTNNELWYIGDPERKEYKEPIKVLNNVIIKDFSAGSYSRSLDIAYFILTQNECYCFGNNFYGELGIHQIDPDYKYNSIKYLKKCSFPFNFKAGNVTTIINDEYVNVKYFASSKNHSYIVTDNGDVYFKGSNKYGQLPPSVESYVANYQYAGNNIEADIKEIECGETFTLVLYGSKVGVPDLVNSLFVTGADSKGQLSTDFFEPDAKILLHNINHVKVIDDMTIVEDMDNEIYYAYKGSGFVNKDGISIDKKLQ